MDVNASRGNGARQRIGFSLIEILLVVAMMTIIAGIVLPKLESNAVDQLERAAQILASDLAYARNLAVVNNSSYRVRFVAVENQYILEHSGTNSALDNLPASQFDNAIDQPTQLVTDIDKLPQIGKTVRISAVFQQDAGSNDRIVDVSHITEVEFGPLGGTTASESTVVWISTSSGTSRRHISVHIDPVTGLATVGEVQSSIGETYYTGHGSIEGDSVTKQTWTGHLTPSTAAMLTTHLMGFAPALHTQREARQCQSKKVTTS